MMAPSERSSHVTQALLSHTHTNENLIEKQETFGVSIIYVFFKSLNFKL